MPKNEVAVDIFEYDDSESEIVAGLNALALTPSTSSELPSKRMSLMEQWNDYFKKGDLEDYQRLCVDLDLPGDLPSKTKCRQALKGVHVNIIQFLACDDKPHEVKFFKNRWALARWSRKKNTFFPRRKLPNGSPLRTLLKIMGN
ncbi:unnamed protein product [Fusarium graminearum]|nr:hypothetical protein FGRA07_06998 [Fusarium graminearum]CAF3552463.1 unnamed protein product [Fusarium graminearum]CAF3578773.1 unnamed protein product [Fusarium graminearum]CAF3628219.1 unnamed protein product [Fusarium graminearum]CAG1964409.1 unnamed protein product [Fusarium graminearum]